ncbi:MAG: 50S ribosomal protein L6 [Candidatus Tectomicrobia bacterium]|uniref:Large ribosomal subunit protein uL6 n=1 Tax=Tectimicrobiota bacterium TaxID=2528274 RepID=A0A932GMR0_UNCTE|nr:50S ribosomal protein L6 [Candidatus Tectomicrobia bacterium]
MSRVGKKPIVYNPKEVEVTPGEGTVQVKGPKGTLSQPVHRLMAVETSSGAILVTPTASSRLSRSLHGLTRTLIANMITGVTQGFKKELEINGVGYRAQVQGKNLTLHLGYSHPIVVPAPDGIHFEVEKNRVTVGGVDKQLVGQVAANLRSLKPPEPYKGKGIKYVEEKIRRKEGKTGAK